MPSSPRAKNPLLQSELSALESFLHAEFPASGLVESEASRMMLGGGKRIRPALAIASAYTGDYSRTKSLPVAAAVEALHVAALIHDDVIDCAETRRGMPTIHELKGNHVAVYAGDWLLARAMALLAASGLPGEGMTRLAQAMKAMCAGEVGQYTGRFRLPGMREYLKRILGKTGVLFAAACEAGGLTGGADSARILKLRSVGLRLGVAFQMRDDLMDFMGESGGKPAERDLADGIVTLPVMLAAEDAGFKKKLIAFLNKNGSKGAEKMVCEARTLGAQEKARRVLANEIEKSMALIRMLPESPGRAMLLDISGSFS